MSEQHAIVVGGTKGLGRIIVQNFLARGYSVSVVSRHKPADFAEGARLRHFAADLERSETLIGLPDTIRDAHGPVSYLVLSQRFRGQGDPWAGEIQVGLTASRQLIEGFAPHYADHGDRAIGVVSSVYAEFVGSSQPVGYHAVKGGLNAMVRHYAATLGRKGIRINAIMPLTYLKPESRAFYEQNEKLMELYRRLVPLGRLGTAEESADAINFLCSERSSFITGQSLFLDGGVSVVWQEEIAKAFSGL
jgi:NAD(P)-dependent dehydrogenase (short-subunit alcohol dehydrogenase family)